MVTYLKQVKMCKVVFNASTCHCTWGILFECSANIVGRLQGNSTRHVLPSACLLWPNIKWVRFVEEYDCWVNKTLPAPQERAWRYFSKGRWFWYLTHIFCSQRNWHWHTYPHNNQPWNHRCLLLYKADPPLKYKGFWINPTVCDSCAAQRPQCSIDDL